MKMAEIKTIYKGESVTLLFTFPEAYDMARLASHKIFVGETEFTGVIEGQAIKMQLKSSDTNRMIGTHRIVCFIDDTTLGLRKPYCGELVITKTQASGSTASVSNISDIIIPIVISETAITVGDVLYNYVKGGKGDPFLYSDFTPEQLEALKVKGDPFTYADFTPEQLEALKPEGENPNVIDMQKGEYLMDIINTINALPEAEKPTVENPITINFYNHNKTIDWSRWNGLIHVPRFVTINFVGNIEWWSVSYFPQMGYDEGLISENPLDKLFLGFSFDRTNDDNRTFLSGLPLNLSMVYFGGLDDTGEEVADYSELDADIHGNGLLGLVRVNGNKEDDIRNNALYKKVNGVFIDITPNFSYCNLSGTNNSIAYFYSANNQGADFYSANNQSTNFYYANNENASFFHADNQNAVFEHSNNQGAYFVSSNNQGAAFYYADNQNAVFEHSNNQGAYFVSSNNQGADFSFANLKQVNWDNVVSIVNANFQYADLTGGINLPERINTKAKWIAECGASNVNAQTIWIDGTSILS